MGSRKISVPLTTAGIEQLIREVKEYETWIQRKAQELAERLAQYGFNYARIEFARAQYDGERGKIDISVERRSGKNRYAVVASGEEILFIEFGTGVRYGYGHPDAAKYGMGPGTYPIPPGKGHWNDPGGWYIPLEKGGRHTYGNPPNMSMFRTGKELHSVLERIARDVFSGN